MELINHIIGALILFFVVIYIWAKLMNKKINFKSLKLYIVWILLSFTSIVTYFSINDFIRIFLLLIFMIIFCKILFNENIKLTIITCCFEQIIIMISETLFALVLYILLKENVEYFLNIFLGKLVSNIGVSFVAFLIIQIKYIRVMYSKIIKFLEKISHKHLIVFSFILMLFANILTVISYYRIEFKYLIAFNTIMTFIFSAIVLYSFKAQNNYRKVSDKYNIAIHSLTDYENMMTKYRIANHENKNLLLTVRAMILNKEKKIPEYIDSIVKQKYADDEKLLLKMSVIPSGGLRATIYSEILKIRDNNIDYFLDIDKKLNTVDLIEMDTNTVIDVCKIIGVFIDNAIDEVKKLDIKNIGISLYISDNNLNIKIINNYEGHIKVEKIFNEGYTTKGEGHGYGLSLVKKIVESNSVFENKTEINRDSFSQTLIIKCKNKKSH